MKNIAIPLLLASSARAEGKKKAAMAQDYGFPAPMLIADAWTDGVCTDAGVTTAQTALTAAQGALATLETEKTPMATAVTDAQTAKATAVAAVVAKDTEIATLLATDDAAQQAELTAKTALDAATYAETAATTAAATALAAKTAADTAKSGGDTLLTAMTTAATNAATHYTAEQAETATLTTAETTATTTHSNANALIANLTTLYTSAKTTSDTNAATTATDLDEKTAADALNTKLTSYLSTADAALLSATDPSVAKNLADATSAMTAILTALNTAGTTNWVPLANTTTKQMTYWVASPTVYNDTGTNQLCNTTAQTAVTSGGPEATVAACKLECDGKKAWRMNGGNTFPTGLVEDGSSGTTHCYGIAFASSSCIMYSTALPTAALGSSGDAAGTTCAIRNKSVIAAALITAAAASDVSQSQYTAMKTALTNWGVQSNLIDDAQGKVDIATQYAAKLLIAKNAANSTAATKLSEYNTAKGISDGTTATTGTKLTNLNTQQATVDAAQAALTAATSAKNIQIAEEAAQLVIKNLADGDVTAQTTAVATLTTAASTADTAKGTADTALTTATATKTTKTTEYGTAVTAAGTSATAVSPGLTELGTLRATAGTATTTLDTAMTALTAQQVLVDADQVKVNTATAAHLASIVSCKETQYDAYAATLATAVATRAAALTTIEALVDANAAAAPTAGAAGARCEKAMSNGTFRPRRDEATCATGLCCGAAKIDVGSAVMIIETCQTETDTTYAYQPPRGPMETTMPATQSVDFTCIQGAQKLAAAASALAAAVYMLA